MSAPDLVIKKQIIEIELPAEVEYDLKGIFLNKVSPLLEKSSRELIKADQVLSLDQVILDVGTIASSELESSFPIKVDGAFRERIQAIAYREEEQPNQPPSIKEASFQNDYKTILHFLSTGNLPWWASSNTTIEVLEQNLLRICSDKHVITEALRSNLKDEYVRLRAVNHFSDQTLLKLVLSLQINRNDWINNLYHDLEKLEKLAACPGLVRSYWLKLLHDASKNQQPEKSGLIEYCLRDKIGVDTRLGKVIDEVGNDLFYGQDIKTVCQNINEETPVNFPEVLKEFLVTGRSFASNLLLEKVIDKLLVDDPHSLRTLLEELLADQSSRSRLVGHLTNHSLKRICELWEISKLPGLLIEVWLRNADFDQIPGSKLTEYWHSVLSIIPELNAQFNTNYWIYLLLSDITREVQLSNDEAIDHFRRVINKLPDTYRAQVKIALDNFDKAPHTWSPQEIKSRAGSIRVIEGGVLKKLTIEELRQLLMEVLQANSGTKTFISELSSNDLKQLRSKANDRRPRNIVEAQSILTKANDPTKVSVQAQIETISTIITHASEYEELRTWLEKKQADYSERSEETDVTFLHSWRSSLKNIIRSEMEGLDFLRSLTDHQWQGVVEKSMAYQTTELMLLYHKLIQLPEGSLSIKESKSKWETRVRYIILSALIENPVTDNWQLYKRIVEKTAIKVGVSSRDLVDLVIEEIRQQNESNGSHHLSQLLEPLVQMNRETKEKSGEKQNKIEEDDIYITNAGLVLLAPFFPGLFDQLNWLGREKQFVKKELTDRAICLMHYMATDQSNPVEFQLPLNKILCGCSTVEPVDIEIRLTKKEKTEGHALINSAIEHWQALKNTSVQGFQEGFLRREGKLTESEKNWTLTVEQTAYDVLMEQLPWSIQVVRLPWMKKPLYIEW